MTQRVEQKIIHVLLHVVRTIYVCTVNQSKYCTRIRFVGKQSEYNMKDIRHRFVAHYRILLSCQNLHLKSAIMFVLQT